MSLFRKLFSNSKISNSLKKNVSKRSLRMEPLEDRQMLSVYGVEISATDFNNISNSYKELNIGQYSDYEGTQTAKNLFVVDANFLENSTMSDLNALLAQQTSGQRVLLFNVGNSQETFAWEGMNINGGNFSIIAGTTGNGSMTLDSTGHQAFNITNTGSLGSTVKIGGLTITNSEGANGGAINLTTVTPVTTVNSLTLSRVTLKNNTATGMGGGIYQDRGNVTLYNVLMVQNTAGSFGGALAVANSMNAVTTIINSTLYNNNSNTPYSGIHFNGTGDNSKITIANSIITNGYGKNDVYFNDTGVAGSRTLVNSLTTSSSSISFIPQNVQLANNKTGDPRFVNVAGGNYTPLLDSPAHNAGDKAYLGQLQYDILGNPRVIDGQVDMGAFQNLGIPDTPTGLTVTAIGANTINLSWDAVGGAESYNVYRYKGTEWVLAAANVTDTSFTQKGLTPGAPYAFCVTAVKGNAESAKSVFVRATTLAMSSTATATATGTRSIDLSWSAVKGAASYDVYRYKNNAWLLVANVAGTTFTQNGLTPGAPYAFRVIARDADGGEITRSATIHAMTLLGLTATATAPKTIDLSWSAVVHAASYDVYRYGNNAWNLVATVAGTTFTQKGLTPDAPYAFRVIARDADGGEMTRSATIQARTLPLLSASTILEATPTALMSSALMSSAAQPTSGFVAAVTDLEAIPTGTRSIDLSWSAVEGATSYDVYRWKGTAWLYVTNVAGTTFTQNGLTPGAPYAFYVVARNGDSVSERTATVRATTFCLPPANLVATATGSRTVQLTWDAVAGATSYDVYRWSNGSWLLVENVSGTTFDERAVLTPNAPYSYSVIAKNVAGDSARSALAQVTTDPRGALANIVDLVFADDLFDSANVVNLGKVDELCTNDGTTTTNKDFAFVPENNFSYTVVTDSDSASMTGVQFAIDNATDYDTVVVCMYDSAADVHRTLAPTDPLLATALPLTHMDGNVWALQTPVTITDSTVMGVYVSRMLAGTFTVNLEAPVVVEDAALVSIVNADMSNGFTFDASAVVSEGNGNFSYTIVDDVERTTTGPVTALKNIVFQVDNVPADTTVMLSTVLHYVDPDTGEVTPVTGGFSGGLASQGNGLYNLESATYFGPFVDGMKYEYQISVGGKVIGSFFVTYNNTFEAPVVTLPSTPVNLVATATGSRTVQLTWDEVAGATSYDVYRWSNGSWLLVGTVDDTVFNEQPVLTPNAPYAYSVIAKNAAGESARSDLVRVTTDPRGALANIVDLVFADDQFDSANVVNLGKVDELCTNDGTTTTNKDFAFVPENNFSYTVVTDSDSASMTSVQFAIDNATDYDTVVVYMYDSAADVHRTLAPADPLLATALTLTHVSGNVWELQTPEGTPVTITDGTVMGVYVSRMLAGTFTVNLEAPVQKDAALATLEVNFTIGTSGTGDSITTTVTGTAPNLEVLCETPKDFVGVPENGLAATFDNYEGDTVAIKYQEAGSDVWASAGTMTREGDTFVLGGNVEDLLFTGTYAFFDAADDTKLLGTMTLTRVAPEMTLDYTALEAAIAWSGTVTRNLYTPQSLATWDNMVRNGNGLLAEKDLVVYTQGKQDTIDLVTFNILNTLVPDTTGNPTGWATAFKEALGKLVADTVGNNIFSTNNTTGDPIITIVNGNTRLTLVVDGVSYNFDGVGSGVGNAMFCVLGNTSFKINITGSPQNPGGSDYKISFATV